jgi:prepilin-type N-terminal cleavage/methylation domain-containing protein
MTKRAFTLMEVVVSVILLAIIGVALIKLSSANIEGATYSKESRLDLTSLPVFSKDKLARVDDYSKIKDIDVPDFDVDKGEEEEIRRYEYEMDENLTLELELIRQDIKVGEQGVSYYRFR